jgi:hypothetical protein
MAVPADEESMLSALSEHVSFVFFFFFHKLPASGKSMFSPMRYFCTLWVIHNDLEIIYR